MAKNSRRKGSRRRYEPAERARLVGQFKDSAMSIAAFARAHSIQYTTFCAWLRRVEDFEVPMEPEFVEVELSSENVEESMNLEIGPRGRVRIKSARQAEWAGRLIAAYDQEGSC